MPDAKAPAAPTRAPIDKAKAAGVGTIGLAAIIAAAVAVQAPRTGQHEGRAYRAALDPAGIPTICDGHTAGVKLGMVATDAQCDAWRKADLAEHMTAVAQDTPTLREQPSALEQAGDFHFNAARWWAASPMRAAFLKRQWSSGCEAFRGYITLAKATKVVPGYRYFRKSNGQLYRELPGLVTRREDERRLCLAGLKL